MLIVADDNIPFAPDVFSEMGTVRTLPSRELDARAVRAAEILLVRSTVKVGESLLDGAATRFVATATIGTDHVDLPYLARRGIAFASAPGSNARSVAEYVTAALLELELRGCLRLAGATLGVVGAGNVGSKAAALARELGMAVLLNDPPRARREGPEGFSPLEEVLASSDVVTFHVPLERAGPDATHRMVNASLLSRMRPGAVLINTSRGEVADGAAVAGARRKGRLSALVLDVWEGEPAPDGGLVEVADIATPHVAGHSYDGKVAGTRMVYEAACRFLGREPAWPTALPPAADLAVEARGDPVREAVRASYDILFDDAAMRELARLPAARRGGEFSRFRSRYRVRREFASWRVRLRDPGSAGAGLVSRLGFTVEETR